LTAFVFAAPRQAFFISCTECARRINALDGCIVKLRFRLQLPWFPKHTKSIEVSADETSVSFPSSV